MSDERAKLVDAIIKLGSSLGLATTAEGIETDASVDWLSDQGCDFGQGYLFGRAMPKSEVDDILSRLVEGKAPATILPEAIVPKDAIITLARAS